MTTGVSFATLQYRLWVGQDEASWRAVIATPETNVRCGSHLRRDHAGASPSVTEKKAKRSCAGSGTLR